MKRTGNVYSMLDESPAGKGPRSKCDEGHKSVLYATEQSEMSRSDGIDRSELFVFGLVVGAFVGFTFAAMVLR